MSQQERMQQVLRMLETRDSVQVAELAETFSVSEVTVRSDLGHTGRTRARRARCGAACGRSSRSGPRSDSIFGCAWRSSAKRAIARAAAEMVDEGEAVALDASTTAYYLALELRAKKELVVVTNGLLVATALADAPGITVLVTGGRASPLCDVARRRPRHRRAPDDPDQQGLPRCSRRSASSAASWISTRTRSAIKQEMADACEQVYGIFDGTKWHRSALLAFVRVGGADRDHHRLERAGGRGRRVARRRGST